MKRNWLMPIVATLLLVGLAFCVAKIYRLESQIRIMNEDVNTGIMRLATVPNHGNALYVSSEKPFLDRGVWLVVAPNGSYKDRANCVNIAGFQVWRLDPRNPESFDNLEWLEIGSASPCWGENSFLITANKFGDGEVRDIVFGTMRKDTDSHQKAFIIRATDGRDIYTLFEHELMIYHSLTSTQDSKLGLFGVEPVGQWGHVEYADNSNVVEKVNRLIDALESYGLLEVD